MTSLENAKRIASEAMERKMVRECTCQCKRCLEAQKEDQLVDIQQLLESYSASKTIWKTKQEVI